MSIEEQYSVCRQRNTTTTATINSKSQDRRKNEKKKKRHDISTALLPNTAKKKGMDTLPHLRILRALPSRKLAPATVTATT
jgi:hypothetical protein